MGNESEPASPSLRGASGDTFAALLDRLKRRGTSVLVVGDLSPDVERSLSRRMMGHPDEPRQRLLAGLKQLESPDRWFPDPVGTDDGSAELLDLAGLPRDAAAADGAVAVATEPPRAEAVVEGIADWIEAVDREGDAGPGEIRVGVASLDVLLEREGMGAPRTFVERVHALMRDHRGVAHLYFPRERSNSIVQGLTVWVDVVVEVRTRDGRPEQRWSVQDTVETSWFPIRDDEPHHRTDR